MSEMPLDQTLEPTADDAGRFSRSTPGVRSPAIGGGSFVR